MLRLKLKLNSLFVQFNNAIYFYLRNFFTNIIFKFVFINHGSELKLKRVERDLVYITIKNYYIGKYESEIDSLCILLGYKPVEGRWTFEYRQDGKYTLHLSSGNRRCSGSTVSAGHSR